jgi:glucokinase
LRETIRKTPLILTLDGGGTNFTFTAVRNGEIVGEPLTLPSHGDEIEACLDQIIGGLQELYNSTGREASAISIGFPGPADYKLGIIGECNNLPAFRGDGVALGPMLEHHFDLPVFIRNDADLFAYGEALAGILPETNKALEESGSTLRYKNLIGITLGTGIGAGIVTNGKLHEGDNSAGAEIWAVRSKLHRDSPVEEDVSIRAVKRVYAEIARMPIEEAPEPEVLAEIARNKQKGHSAAARESYRRFGEALGDAIANVLTITDGLVVIGGGISAAHDLFMPAVMQELNAPYQPRDGRSAPRTVIKALNLEDETDRRSFLAHKTRDIPIPRSQQHVTFDPMKRTGVGISKLGTTRAVAIGAYEVATSQISARAAAAPATAKAEK